MTHIDISEKKGSSIQLRKWNIAALTTRGPTLQVVHQLTFRWVQRQNRIMGQTYIYKCWYHLFYCLSFFISNIFIQGKTFSHWLFSHVALCTHILWTHIKYTKYIKSIFRGKRPKMKNIIASVYEQCMTIHINTNDNSYKIQMRTKQNNLNTKARFAVTVL